MASEEHNDGFFSTLFMLAVFFMCLAIVQKIIQLQDKMEDRSAAVQYQLKQINDNIAGILDVLEGVSDEP